MELILLTLFIGSFNKICIEIVWDNLNIVFFSKELFHLFHRICRPDTTNLIISDRHLLLLYIKSEPRFLITRVTGCSTSGKCTSCNSGTCYTP